MRGTHTELLLLRDGRILVHNLTPAMAAVLHRLVPKDLRMKRRAIGARASLRDGRTAGRNFPRPRKP